MKLLVKAKDPQPQGQPLESAQECGRPPRATLLLGQRPLAGRPQVIKVPPVRGETDGMRLPEQKEVSVGYCSIICF